MGEVTLDTSDVDRWVGVPLGGGYLKDPVHVNDIRRWAQGMQNPNPLLRRPLRRRGAVRRIVAPQSFAVATDVGHGATPAIQGTIPGSHMIFGGDEWWFFGLGIEPGDNIKGERMLFDYRVTETKFAGPTMFSRGDTTYINQRGEMIAKQRSTSIRYLAEEAPGASSSARRTTRGATTPWRTSRSRSSPTTPRPRPRQGPVEGRERGRSAPDAADRAPHADDLHHRVARLQHEHLGRRRLLGRR